MTHNQIDYWNLQEQKRHNVVGEGETARHNVATESETNRHNLVTEGIDLGNLNETRRHNMASEGLEAGKLSETTRHNIASESESARHNVATENLSGIDLNIKRSQLYENVRHNQAGEHLTGLDLNIQSGLLGEKVRHNQATENLTAQRNAAQNALDQARTQYQDIVNTWESVQRTQGYRLTESQIKQANAYIDKLNTEIGQMEQNMQWKTYEEILNGVDTFNRTAQTGAKYIDAFIPG